MSDRSVTRDDVAEIFTGLLKEFRQDADFLSKLVRDNRETLGCAYEPLGRLARSVYIAVLECECAQCHNLGVIPLSEGVRLCAQCATERHFPTRDDGADAIYNEATGK